MRLKQADAVNLHLPKKTRASLGGLSQTLPVWQTSDNTVQVNCIGSYSFTLKVGKVKLTEQRFGFTPCFSQCSGLPDPCVEGD